ncbi:MAG: potassium channel family protein [Flavobacteriaceae bacterium]|nr:potassium channel family protein [Flavobacteriaceae bacterium]
MLINIIIGFTVIGTTVAVQAFGTNFWVGHISKKYKHLSPEVFKKKNVNLLITTSLFILLLHFFQASIWALVYLLLPGITEFETFEKAIYFSLVTFTTLGYGEITIGSANRILAGFEAINGILLIGWSTAFMFSVVQYIWKRVFKNEPVQIINKK